MNEWIEALPDGTRFVSVHEDIFGQKIIGKMTYQKEAHAVWMDGAGLNPFEFDFSEFGPTETFLTLEEAEALRVEQNATQR